MDDKQSRYRALDYNAAGGKNNGDMSAAGV